MKYRDGMDASEEKSLMAEIEAEDAAYAAAFVEPNVPTTCTHDGVEQPICVDCWDALAEASEERTLLRKAGLSRGQP